MGILEGVVIATIVLAGAYVGYHAWQESLHAPEAEGHSTDLGFPYHGPQAGDAKSHSQVFVPTKLR